MFKNTFIIRMITCLICLFFLGYGCTDKKSEPEPPKKIVSKKISVQPQKSAEVQKVAPQPAASSKQTTAVETTSKGSVKSQEKESAGAGEDDLSIPSAPALDQARLLAHVAVGYDPKGKIDPFIPLIRDEPQKVAAAATKKVERKKRIPTTPLERIALNQLRLRAIVRSASGNKALVEEASGKGYIITKGTFIGVNQGTVIEIQKDRIIVEEEIENIQGEITVKTKELRLPKPPGEE